VKKIPETLHNAIQAVARVAVYEALPTARFRIEHRRDNWVAMFREHPRDPWMSLDLAAVRLRCGGSLEHFYDETDLAHRRIPTSQPSITPGSGLPKPHMTRE
jgi:hypothetical protein